MNVQYWCPACGEHALWLEPGRDAPKPCPGCSKVLEPILTGKVLEENMLERCVACGERRFYVQKDFNRVLGVVIVALIIAISFFLYYWIGFWAYAFLFGTILLDIAAYRLMPDVTICYACKAIYRGNKPNPEHGGFHLPTADRFGPE